MGLLLAVSSAFAGAASGTAPPEGTSELLERLEAGARVLFVGAHPDDEITAGPLLARASETGPVLIACLTSGEGGPNRIGTERDEALGRIRVEELKASCKVLGAECRTLGFWNGLPGGVRNPANARETPQQAIARWRRSGRDPLAELVRLIRQWKPDIMVSFDPRQGFTGHKEHRAAGMLALEAFHAAADPSRFPDQTTRSPPHQVERLYFVVNLHAAKIHPGLPQYTMEQITALVDGNVPSKRGGRTYTDIAIEAWACHASQVGRDFLNRPEAARMREMISRTALILAASGHRERTLGR